MANAATDGPATGEPVPLNDGTVIPPIGLGTFGFKGNSRRLREFEPVMSAEGGKARRRERP